MWRPILGHALPSTHTNSQADGFTPGRPALVPRQPSHASAGVSVTSAATGVRPSARAGTPSRMAHASLQYSLTLTGPQAIAQAPGTSRRPAEAIASSRLGDGAIDVPHQLLALQMCRQPNRAAVLLALEGLDVGSAVRDGVWVVEAILLRSLLV